METPSRGSVAGTSPIRTPFSERAAEKDAGLRDEYLMSMTPGLRKRKRGVDTVGLSRDPGELRTYLQDLSFTLASQSRKKNLFEELHNEATSVILERSNESSHVEVEAAEVSGLVSAQNDVIASPSPPSPPPLVANEDDIEQLENSIVASPSATLPQPAKLQQPLELEEEPEKFHQVKPLKTGQLRHTLQMFLEENHIPIVKSSWTYLASVSGLLVQKLAADLEDENHNIVADRRAIFEVLGKYDIIPATATNEELFEMCCKYLPLEELNEIELALFS